MDMMGLNLLIGSGGVLSHAPRRCQAAHMLIDAFLPEGITMLAVDSIFMMPQLGVLSEVHPKAATEVFDKDCLIKLGTCVAPTGPFKKAKVLATLKMTRSDGSLEEHPIKIGSIELIPMGVGEKVQAEIIPAKHIDAGAGLGETWTGELEGGVVGLILDGRGRQPFELPEDEVTRVARLQEWSKALDTYPECFLSMGGDE